MSDDPIPFYPDLRCWQAPLRPSATPKDGCGCAVCGWARSAALGDAALGPIGTPIRPGTPEWDVLLRLAR